MANELQVRQDGIGGLIEDNPLTSGATTLTSAALAAMGAIGSTQYAWVILDPEGIGGAPEHVKVTAHTAGATTATIARGLDTTTARQHEANGPVPIRWEHGPVASDDYRPRLLQVRDEKTSGTNGGASTTGSWVTRTLQTIQTNEVAATLSSNEIVLPAGTYDIDGSSPGFACGNHQARLYNVTGAAVLVLGTTEVAHQSDTVKTRSFVQGRFTLAVASNVRIEHRFGVAYANGMGFASGWGVEVYTDCQLRKVS